MGILYFTKNKFFQFILRAICFLIFEIVFIGTSYAIKPYQPVMEDPLTESWRWQTFPALNGQDVRCMTEAANHVMWFGLKDGIMKFNGFNWEKHDKNNGFISESVNHLLTTKNKQVYAGTNYGLFRLKENKWERAYPFQSIAKDNFSPINTLCELHDGSVLASIGYLNTEYAGLLLIRNNKSTLLCSPNSYNLYKKKFPNTSIRIIPKDLLINENISVRTIFEDKQHRIWIINYHNKKQNLLFYIKSIDNLSNNKKFSNRDGLKIGRYSSLSQVNDGSIYMTNSKSLEGIMAYKNYSWKKVRTCDEMEDNVYFTSILDTPKDGLFIGGFGTLYAKRNGIWKSYKEPNIPIPNAQIRIFKDSKGYLWILGYRYEVVRNDYVGGKWNTFKEINYQCTSSDKKQWFISVNNRVVVNDGNKWYSYGTEDGLPEGTNSILLSRAGTLWVSGNDNNTAATAYFDGERWHKKLHPSLSWSVSNRSLFEDSKKRIWIGCSTNLIDERGQKGGVMYLEDPSISKDNWIQFPSTDTVKFKNAYGIGESTDNQIWVGGSLLRTYKDGRWSNYQIPQQRGFIDIVKSTPNGLLWVGTRIDGLYSYNGNRWRNYNYKNGLVTNCIIDISIISDSSVWVATDKDISHFDGKSWTNNIFPKELTLIREAGDLKIENKQYVWINSSSFEWKRRFKHVKDLDASMKESFKTTRYQMGRNAPETYITSYYDEVPYKGNSYITWSGVDSWQHTPADRLSYSYRFNGGEWSSFTEETNKTFTNLESGDYVMEVRARDLDFNTDLTPARIEFIVAPPVWKQLWFISLISIFLIIIIVYQIRLIKRNKTLNTAKLELENKNFKITAQKEDIMKIAEREQESNQQRIKFFTNITHDFRTPLTLILGSLDRISTLKIKSDTTGLKKYLSLVQKNSEQLLRLINQLMDFRKAETETMGLKVAKGNIIKFTENIVSSFHSHMEMHHIQLLFDQGVDDISAWYDAEKIEKILYNLISNAIKFTPENGVIKVSIKLEDSKENYQIIVQDTGIGIPQDDIIKIIEPFYQANNKAIRNEEGTGIGLSLVKKLVEIHYGTIHIHSNTKKESAQSYNTTFTITLPMGKTLFKSDEIILDEALDSTETNNSSEKSNDKEHDSNNISLNNDQTNDTLKPKILVIDDNAEIRAFIIDTLSNMYDLIEAVNGEDGLLKAIKFLPDIVICDLMMPIMNGTEFCAKSKSDERLSHIPIILLTANNAEESMIQGYETGADDYMTKPFKTKILELRIKNILDNREILRQRFKTEISLEPKSMNITTVDADFLQKTIDIVDNNIKDENFDVVMLSSELNISPRQLHNKLTALTDMSPGEFIRVYRLKKAAEFLVKKQTSISEVAYDFGFSNPKYFSKSFRQQFGLTPSEYIKKNS